MIRNNDGLVFRCINTSHGLIELTGELFFVMNQSMPLTHDMPEGYECYNLHDEPDQRVSSIQARHGTASWWAQTERWVAGR